jgi:hypothetical protein
MGQPKKDKSEQKQSSTNIGDRASERQRERTERVCRELLEGYTDDFSLQENGKIEHSDSSIASQWGLNRGKIFRMIEAIYQIKPKSDSQSETLNTESAKQQLVPLTLAELVEILGNLARREKPQKPLIKEDILRIIQRFVELYPEERETLGLNPGICNAIIQQIIRIIELDHTNDYQKLDLLRFYEILLNKSKNNYFDLDVSPEESKQDQSNRFDENIRKLVENILTEYKADNSEESIQQFVLAVEAEKRKVEADCVLSSSDTKDRLNNTFIHSLVQAVVENKLLAQKIPIRLKHYNIVKVRPLPLFVKDEEHQNGVLNSCFTSLKQWTYSVERQHAYTVSIYLDIKLTENFKKDYKILFPDYADFKVSEGKLGGQILPYHLESSGTGGQITHLTRLINLSLLKDIPCLNDYFPIAHDIILITPGILRQSNSSPLAYHTLTMLCKRKYVEEAATQNKAYNEICSDQQAFYGNYCGFDLIECAAKSSLFSRIRAITKIGSNTNTYITQFCNKVERANQRMKALSYLRSYPFSMFAMQSHLEETIFHEILSDDVNQPVSILEATIEDEKFKKWNDDTLETYLELIDAYLTEGLYKSADILIKKIEKFFEQTNDEETFLNSTTRTKFEICRARYYSIVDLDEYSKENPHTNMSQGKLLQKALDHLDEAEKLLMGRLDKYKAIDERAQSNFSPFYNLHAQISFYRAKLNLFYTINQEQKSVKELTDSNLKPLKQIKAIFLFEKARIFAAMDGDSEYYSYYSAYQAIAYLVTAFIGEKASPEFSRLECLDWAGKLIEHAIICYTDIGNYSYQRIKEKSGIGIEDLVKEDKPRPEYGRYDIQNIPSIIEIPRDEKNFFYFKKVLEQQVKKEKSDEEFIFLDMAALSMRAKQFKHFHITHTPGIYLFGTYASIILFARGLYTLCNADNDDSKQKFFADIELASRMFTYAWATAEDNCVSTKLVPIEPSDEPERKFRLERIFFDHEKNKTKNNDTYNRHWESYYKDFSDSYRKEVSYIKDIYPHRVTEIADFGKIFAAVCKYLLLFDKNLDWDKRYREEDLEKDIKALMNKLHSYLPETIDKPDYYSQQKDFNGHFRKAFERVKDYMTDQLKSYKSEKTPINSRRDQVVQTIFSFLFDQNA